MSTSLDKPDRDHRISLDEYHQMIAQGVLTPAHRVELRHGRLVPMSPMGPDHAIQVEKLNRFLMKEVLNQALDHLRVRSQLPLILTDNSEVHPDFVLLTEPETPGQNPNAAAALLVIEISDSTLRRDRDEQLPLYAASAVPEAWIVELSNKEHPKLLVYRTPVNGQYTQVSEHLTGQITAQKIPELPLYVPHILVPTPTRALGPAKHR